MLTWIEITSKGRIIAFHDHAESDLDSVLPSLRYSALLSLGSLVKPSLVGGGSSAPNMSVRIENGDGRFTALLADMIGDTVTVKRTTGTLFSGVIERLSIAEVVEVRVVG